MISPKKTQWRWISCFPEFKKYIFLLAMKRRPLTDPLVHALSAIRSLCVGETSTPRKGIKSFTRQGTRTSFVLFWGIDEMSDFIVFILFFEMLSVFIGASRKFIKLFTLPWIWSSGALSWGIYEINFAIFFKYIFSVTSAIFFSVLWFYFHVMMCLNHVFFCYFRYCFQRFEFII